MKKIVINSDNRRFNISSIVVGYLDENKTEKIEFIIPDKYKEFGKKACFDANGQKFAKIFDDITGDTLTFTRDITKYKELEMSIEFFKIENEDEIIARTSNLHIIIENAVICNDDISPDEPKIIILDKLIEEVTKVGLEVGEKGNYAKEQGDYAKSQAENVISANTEAIKIINNFENNVEAYTTSFNENANNKTTDFDSNAESKTSDFNQNVDNKISEYNNNASEKLSAYNTNASAKLQEYNDNATQKIAEYDEHSQELDNKIIDTRNELERVKNDVLETGTDTDTYIHLEDSAMAEYQELEVDGVCEQETTNGKQMLKFNDINDTTTSGITYSLSNDEITLNGVATINGGINLPLKIDQKLLVDNYTLSMTVNNGSKIQGKMFNVILNSNIKYYGQFSTNTKQTIAIEKEFNLQHIRIYWEANIVFNNFKIKLQLEQGSTATEWEKYTGGQPSPSPSYPQPISTIENSLKITSCNKNLIEPKIATNSINGITLTNNGDGSYTLDGTATANMSFNFNNIEITFKKGSYIFNNNTALPVGVWYSLISFDTGTPRYLFSTLVNQNIKTLTFDKDTKFKRIQEYIYINKGVSLNNLVIKPQLEFGATATPYEQHLETQITANLPEGEFIGKIDNTYKDTLKVEYNADDGQYHLKLYKGVGKVVLDGSENWNTNQVSGNNIRFHSRVFLNEQPKTHNIGISNYFQVSAENYESGISLYKGDKSVYIWVPKTLATTLDEWKTWLSTHNVEIYYPLETPYVLDLGVVDMPITYNEVTNLFTDSDLMPSINAKYYRNFITTIQNLQVNEKALKQELVDINNRLSALESASANVVSESEVIE